MTRLTLVLVICACGGSRGVDSQPTVAPVQPLTAPTRPVARPDVIEWMDDYETAVARAQSEGRPLVVEFVADWAAQSLVLEDALMSDRRVVAALQRFVTARIDLSGQAAAPEDRVELLRTRYHQPGLPFIVMHESNGMEAHRVTGHVTVDEFVRVLSVIE